MLNIVPRVVAYTSCNRSYLPRAYLLAQTLRDAHPDWEIQALIVDDPLDDEEAAAFEAVFDRLVYAADLGFERFKSWIFKHDVVEACTAVKGRMLRRLLAESYDRVVYFDPDIAVFHRLDTVVDCLETASVVLTPHQLAANDQVFAITDNELASMQYGIYNLGFIAVANDVIGRDFAAWWDGHLTRACYDEPERGIFTDQKYCDLVPSLFDRVAILRDPGCNVASWNISRRSLAVTQGGDIAANDSALKFYHFTKIFDIGSIMTDKYCRSNIVVIELVNWYRRRIVEIQNHLGLAPRRWTYADFSNGVAIPKAARVVYRRRSDLISYFGDPFETDGNSLYRWLQREAPEALLE